MKEREPPDSWEMEFSDPPVSSQSPIQKPWKGAAGLIPKTTDIVKRPMVDPKEVKRKKKVVHLKLYLFLTSMVIPLANIQRQPYYFHVYRPIYTKREMEIVKTNY